MGDGVRRVLLRHLLLGKKPYGVALLLVENGHENVCARHRIPTHTLYMSHRTLYDPLKGRCQCGIALVSIASVLSSLSIVLARFAFRAARSSLQIFSTAEALASSIRARSRCSSVAYSCPRALASDRPMECQFNSRENTGGKWPFRLTGLRYRFGGRRRWSGGGLAGSSRSLADRGGERIPIGRAEYRGDQLEALADSDLETLGGESRTQGVRHVLASRKSRMSAFA
jgi:hypothetical protein